MYRKILVPLDGSELAECVLPHVEAMARSCNTGSIILTRVVEPLGLPVGVEYDIYFRKDLQEDWQLLEMEEKAVAEKYLHQVADELRKSGCDVRSQVLVGKVAEGLAKYATEQGADLIVIATHGRSGISRWVWGSTADRLLRASCVPVLMVRPPECLPGL
jgi:nucleotide-binding universal stress UspA family protein